VLTTSSPGLTWLCVLGAELDLEEAAVLTSPGAAVGDLGGDLGRQLSAAQVLCESPQVSVVGHRLDPVYEWASSLPPPPGTTASRPPRIPGLAENALRTVRASVHALARSGLLHKGTVVLGTVVEGDGSAENVALEIAEERRTERSGDDEVKINAGGRKIGWQELGTELEQGGIRDIHELDKLDIAAVDERPDDVATALSTGEATGAADSGGAIHTGPAEVAGALASGPISGAGPLGTGSSALAYVGGRDRGGSITLGVRTHGGMADVGSSIQGANPLGAAIEAGVATLSDQVASQAVSHALGDVDGAVSLGRIADEGDHAGIELLAADSAEIPVLQLEDIDPVSAPAIEVDADDSLFEAWLDKEQAADDRGRHNQPRPSPPQSKEASLQQRLGEAAETLHLFLDTRCKRHSLTRDTGRMLRAGATPAPIMRNLLALVREHGHDLPAVRAAYGTLEMAQSLLSRDEMTTVLKKIFSQ